MNKDKFSKIIEDICREMAALRRHINDIDDVNFLREMGEEFFDKPEYAVLFYERAVQVNPLDLDSIVSAGACYLLAGNDLDAYYMLRRAQKISTTDEGVVMLASSVLASTSRLPKNL